MLERVALWFLTMILNWLYGKAKNEVNNALNDMHTDKVRGEADEINIKKYEEAKDRKTKIEAAHNLLNGTRSS